MTNLITSDRLVVTSATAAGVASGGLRLDFAEVARCLRAAAADPSSPREQLVLGMHARAAQELWVRLGNDPLVPLPARSQTSAAMQAAAGLADGPLFSSRSRFDRTRLATVTAYLARFEGPAVRTAPAAGEESELHDLAVMLQPPAVDDPRERHELRSQTVAAVAEHTLRLVLRAPDEPAAAAIDLAPFRLGSFEDATNLLRSLMCDFDATSTWSRTATARAAADLVRFCRAMQPTLLF